MVKLVKVAGTSWSGNGFGTAPAVWAVKGAEHIEVLKIAGLWRAIASGVKYIARGSTKAECLDMLQHKL